LTATSLVLLSVIFIPRGRQESGSSGAPNQGTHEATSKKKI
jgi:hypothetical protein